MQKRFNIGVWTGKGGQDNAEWTTNNVLSVQGSDTTMYNKSYTAGNNKKLTRQIASGHYNKEHYKATSYHLIFELH